MNTHMYTHKRTHTHTHTQKYELSSDSESTIDHPSSISWSSTLTSIRRRPFTSAIGPTVPIPQSPSEIFELFFTPAIMQDIVNESNRYAKQMMGDDKYQEWTPMTVPELKAYFGFCILMGITKLPAIDDYWKKDPLLHYDPIASRITRERFRDIRRYLHFVDNTTLPTSGSAGRDRLAKIRPLITDITTKCQQLYNPHQDVAVDEAMIKFQGRSTLKQYAGFFVEKRFRGGKAPITKKVGGGQMLPKAAMPRSGPVGGSGGIPP